MIVTHVANRGTDHSSMLHQQLQETKRGFPVCGGITGVMVLLAEGEMVSLGKKECVRPGTVTRFGVVLDNVKIFWRANLNCAPAGF